MNDNQNAFVTRSTSRVLAEPGGKSSMGFLFGGGGSTTPKKQQTSNNTCTEEQKNNSVVATKAVEETTTNDKKKDEEEKVVASTTAVQEEESAITAAARIKAQNESQHFSLFGGSSNVKVIDESKVSANAYASSATTNSYNVLTDRPTSRVVSFVLVYYLCFMFVSWCDVLFMRGFSYVFDL